MHFLVIQSILLVLGIPLVYAGIHTIVIATFSPFDPTAIVHIAVGAALILVGICISLLYAVVPKHKVSFHWTQIKPSGSPARGPKLSPSQPITPAFVQSLIDFYRTGNGTAVLDDYLVYRIVQEAIPIIRSRPLLTRMTVERGDHLTVVGDVHGQFFDVLQLFAMNGMPSASNPYIFNGDLVDRGSFGVEIVMVLFAFVCADPSSVFIAKGNHEDTSVNTLYGFRNEVNYKHDDGVYVLIQSLLDLLPYAHLINDSIFVVHGGIPTQPVDISTIDATLPRGHLEGTDSIATQFLWNDPAGGDDDTHSLRNIGYRFGLKTTLAFLSQNNLSMVIRSHEAKDKGYEYTHNNKCLTLFSAPNYCGNVGNNGAFAIINNTAKDGLTTTIKTFGASEHPAVEPYFQKRIPSKRMPSMNPEWETLGMGITVLGLLAVALFSILV